MSNKDIKNNLSNKDSSNSNLNFRYNVDDLSLNTININIYNYIKSPSNNDINSSKNNNIDLFVLDTCRNKINANNNAPSTNNYLGENRNTILSNINLPNNNLIISNNSNKNNKQYNSVWDNDYLDNAHDNTSDNTQDNTDDNQDNSNNEVKDYKFYQKTTKDILNNMDDLLDKIDNEFKILYENKLTNLSLDNYKLSPRPRTPRPLSKYSNSFYEPPVSIYDISENITSQSNKIIKKDFITIDIEINGLKDMLSIIEEYPLMDEIEYNIDMEVLHKLKEPLKELDSMIGMNRLKNNITDQIIYYIQGFHNMGYNSNDFMHTVIYGPPGTGKTEVAKIIGKIFCNLGILKHGKFKKATRSDLIAGYLGQTALKTQSLIHDCLGGVLFIDEAYALGNNEKRDSFAKECIDTLCESLSNYKDSIMVIIAGYEDELKTCFFDYNEGLESRFTWRFKTDDYTPEELREIFIKKVNDIGWYIDAPETITVDWFKNKLEYFKYFGRDIETLLAKTKICHSRRVFCKDILERTHITIEDLNNGFNLYSHYDREDNIDKVKDIIPSMYI